MNDLVSDFSSTKNTKAAQRTIFHVDVNSAYLSWSALKQLRLSPGSVDLRTVPSAVGGDVKSRHGIITAKSIPAIAAVGKTAVTPKIDRRTFSSNNPIKLIRKIRSVSRQIRKVCGTLRISSE